MQNEAASISQLFESTRNLTTGVRTNFLPKFTQSITGLDYVIYSGLDKSNYYNSGSATDLIIFL